MEPVEKSQRSSTIPYESPDGSHRHKCYNCEHVWEHGDFCINKTRLHTCPNCNDEQWTKYFGPEVPNTTMKMPPTISIEEMVRNLFDLLLR